MEHFYESILGWFSYDYIYKDIVEQATGDCLFVEIGSFRGRSTAFLAVEIANSGKNIQLECIDPMKLLGHYADSAVEKPEEFAGYSATEFHKRLASVNHIYKLHEMISDDTCALYEDGTIDFIMIDGDHSYEGVKKDLINFLPKMRSGGLVTGDDAYVPEIMKAVNEVAGHLSPVNNGIHFFINIP